MPNLNLFFIFEKPTHSTRDHSPVMMEEETQATSHKEVNSYTLSFKVTAIEYAEIHGNTAAERKFNVDLKNISGMEI